MVVGVSDVVSDTPGGEFHYTSADVELPAQLSMPALPAGTWKIAMECDQHENWRWVDYQDLWLDGTTGEWLDGKSLATAPTATLTQQDITVTAPVTSPLLLENPPRPTAPKPTNKRTRVSISIVKRSAAVATVKLSQRRSMRIVLRRWNGRVWAPVATRVTNRSGAARLVLSRPGRYVVTAAPTASTYPARSRVFVRR